MIDKIMPIGTIPVEMKTSDRELHSAPLLHLRGRHPVSTCISLFRLTCPAHERCVLPPFVAMA